MSKLKAWLLLLPIFVAGCATPAPPPTAPVCPKPPQLPALQALPQKVTGPSFLQRLDSLLWPKQSAQTNYGLPSAPAPGSTTPREQR